MLITTLAVLFVLEISLFSAKMKLVKIREISQFRLFLAPGIDFLGKNTWEIVYLKKIRDNFFRPFFGKIAYFSLFSPNISKILAPESGRKLKFFLEIIQTII